MVIVAPGSFTMGHEGGEADRYEGPPHPVRIDRSFAMGRYEVTNAEFADFVAEGGAEPSGPCAFFDGETGFMDPKRNWRDPGYGREPRPDEPVVCVSWLDAQRFLAWLTKKSGRVYRLPTEAEWEYAARTSPTRDVPWGTDEGAACRVANVLDRSYAESRQAPVPTASCSDGYPLLAPVGSFPADPKGIHDLVGNVWEWVQDCYVVPYSVGKNTGKAVEVDRECAYRSVRGGSWLTRPDRLRVTWRGRDPADAHSWVFGFRVARDLN